MIDTDYTVMGPIGILHPGEVVLEYLESNGWNQRDLSRRSGITPKTISEICNGKAPITPSTSLVLEKVFSRPAHFWLNLQRQFDEIAAREEFLEKAQHWIDWSKKFPIQELKSLGLIPETRGATDNLEAILSFLGVSSPESWNEVWIASRVSFRQTRKIDISVEYISAWVRATEHFANEFEISEFDTTAVVSSIEKLRGCTTYSVEEGIPLAQSICASIGIAFVLVPGFKNTGISGCARWLSSRKALIALSNRYKTDDRLWFTFFHELAHLLLHRKTHAFVLDNAVDDLSDKIVDPTIQKQEDEANRFAADTLIPPDLFAEFVKFDEYSNQSILKFSEAVGVSPGIVVGRLQHEDFLEPYQGNKLKQIVNIGIH